MWKIVQEPDRFVARDLGDARFSNTLDVPAFVTFECTSPPISTLDCLRSIIVTLSRSGRLGAAPLTFVGLGADEAPLIGACDSLDFRWALSVDGNLATLTCGSKVVGSDAFVAFFRNMSPGMTQDHTERSLRLFASFLPGA